MKATTFRELEHRGWTAKAHTYRDALGVVTAQAIDPLLDTFGNLAGKRLLEVACGPGDLAAAAADRSEERRVGKECSELCRSRWSPYH